MTRAEESCERHQIYASLRDAGRECVAQVVWNPVIVTQSLAACSVTLSCAELIRPM